MIIFYIDLIYKMNVFHILNEYVCEDVCQIINDYLMISMEEAINNKYIVNIHLRAMFELRERVKNNRAATFSFTHQSDEDLELDLYFKDILTVMIAVK